MRQTQRFLLTLACFFSVPSMMAQGTGGTTGGTGGDTVTTSPDGTLIGPDTSAAGTMGTDTTALPPVAPAPTTADAEQDDDSDWGWIGLLGLAGLAGLRRRDDDRHDHRTP